MAYSILFKPHTDSANAEFPYGKIRDKIDGVQEGTPVNALTYNDFHQFFAKIMDVAGIAFNNVEENAYDGFQYYDALVAVIIGLINTLVIAPGAWTDFGLAANVANVGAPYANAGYSKDKLGRVTLRGRVTYNGSSSGSNINLFSAVLPAGFLPLFNQNFICEFAIVGYSITSLTSSHSFSIQIDASGNVKLLNWIHLNPGDSIDLSLDGISFLTV